MILVYHFIKAVEAVVGSIVVVDTLTGCQLMLCKFKLDVTKNIFCSKGEETVNPSAITRWLMKFHSGWKKLDDQVITGRPKGVDSETMLQAIEPNPASNT